jgi:tetratricopeptide (TPR) repeat protein
MMSESPGQAIISCEHGGLEPLARLQHFLRSNSFTGELASASNANGQPLWRLSVPVSASQMKDFTKLVQSWLREQETGQSIESINIEYHPSRASTAFGGQSFDMVGLSALAALMRVNDFDSLKAAVNAFPVLMDDQFDTFAESMIAAQAAPDARSYMETRLRALQDFRASLRNLLDEPQAAERPSVSWLDRFKNCWEGYEATHLTSFLDRALELAEQLTAAEHHDLLTPVTCMVSAACYETYKEKENRRYLDRSIALCHTALASEPPESDGRDRLSNQIGLALKARFRIDRRLDDIDQAIRYFRAVIARGNPRMTVNLADSLRARVDVSMTLEDVDEAISLYQKALTNPDFSQSIRSNILRNLAKAKETRFDNTGQSDDLDEAIKLYRTTIGQLSADGDPSLPAVYGEFSQALLTRYERNGQRSDLTEAIDAIKNASQTAGSKSFHIELTRGNAYRDLFQADGAPDTLEASISAYESAISIARGEEKPTALVNFANTMFDQYRRDGDLADLQRAIDLAREARSLAPDARSTILSSNLLANLLGEMQARGEDIGDPDEAVNLLRSALALEGDGLQRAFVQHSLGVALIRRMQEKGDPADFGEASELITAAYDRLPPGSPERGNIANSLSYLHLRRSQSHPQQADEQLENAIRIAEEAVAEAQPGSMAHFDLLFNIAEFRRVRFERSGADTDLRAALQSYRMAAQSPERSIGRLLRSGLSWSRLAYDAREWSEAADAGRMALAALDSLTEAPLSKAAKEGWIADIRDLGSRTAIAFSKLEHYGEAVLALESTSAILLAQSLRMSQVQVDHLRSEGWVDLADRFEAVQSWLSYSDNVDELAPISAKPIFLASARRSMNVIKRELDEVIENIRAVPGHEEFLRPVQLAQIQEVTQDAPLVYLCAHDKEGLALIVDSKTIPAVQCVWLPKFTLDSLTRHASISITFNELDAVSEPDPSAQELRRTMLQDTCRWMWDAVLGPVFAVRNDISKAVLVASGLSAFLPFHAACADGSESGKGVYAVDRVTLSYTPNARALFGSKAARDVPAARRICVVANPSPTSSSDLPGAEREGAAVAGFFADALVLQGVAATRNAVLESIGNASILHFACHGEADIHDGLESGLVLANDETITVGDLMRRRLDGVDMAVLSACQTGVPAIRLVGELVGLPTGLLQSGVKTVIATMWSIDDVATMLLVDRFYYLWQVKKANSADALCVAQRWLRDTTNAEKIRDLIDEHKNSVEADILEILKTGDPEEKSYEDPQYWAAFSYNGSLKA